MSRAALEQVNVHHVSAQGVNERMIDVHYYYYVLIFTRMLGES